MGREAMKGISAVTMGNIVGPICAAMLVLMLLPVLAAITLAIGGCGRPPLFRQSRVGRYGQSFLIIKFRTLDSAPRLPTHVRDAAFGRVSAALRRSRLDELPQLINIMRGEMAFVGPRPLMEQDISAMGAARNIRQSVKPGLTGLAQLTGGNGLSLERKLALDLHYVAHKSLHYDLRLLLFTFPCMVLGIETRIR